MHIFIIFSYIPLIYYSKYQHFLHQLSVLKSERNFIEFYHKFKVTLPNEHISIWMEIFLQVTHKVWTICKSILQQHNLEKFMWTFWAIKSAAGVVSQSVSQLSQLNTHMNALYLSASLFVSHLWRLQQGQPPSFSTHTRTNFMYLPIKYVYIIVFM